MTPRKIIVSALLLFLGLALLTTSKQQGAVSAQGEEYSALVLPAPSPGDGTHAAALNNSGQVFGFAGVGAVSSYVPVLWTGGVPSVLPVPTGYSLIAPDHSLIN